MTDTPPDRAWLATLARAEHAIDRLRHRVRPRVPAHIATYRGWGDASGVHVEGRVLARAPAGGPTEPGSAWRNLRESVRRFATREVPDTPVILDAGDGPVRVVTDDEGYYAATLMPPPPPDGLTLELRASLPDGSLATPQPLVYVHDDAAVGVISDIDDTVLESSITDWVTAAKLTFLHDARTRKPLRGAALLYRALQEGVDGRGRVPVFYVSSSPWNLYDLLDEFMALNGLPPGPMRLRDFGIDAGKFVKSAGHGHKLERARELIMRFPRLRWVLLGDSGQADAELYGDAAREFGDRIAAIYIRDVDPDRDSPLDRAVDAHIERIAGTRVPMLRAPDSRAIAAHAASLGLLRPERLDAIAAEVERDARRPTLDEAAADAALASVAPTTGGDDPAR